MSDDPSPPPPVPEDLTRTFELVRRAQSGDRAALNRLFDRYYERVRRAVRVRIGRGLRQRLDSGDVLQMVFAKAFQKFDQFDMRNEGALLHWLAEIAEGQIRDEADKGNAKKRKPEAGVVSMHGGDEDGSEPALQVPASVTGPVDKVHKQELKSAVDDALEALPEHYREVIVLRDYESMEWRDIAHRLGKNTDSAARELHSRAMFALSAELRKRGVNPNAE